MSCRATCLALLVLVTAACSESGAASAPAPAPKRSEAVASPAATSAAAPVGPRYTRPGDDVLRQRLTPMQYEVTQHAATEPPFHNAYWDQHAEGLYVDVVTGEPLFCSLDKFDSGTGWPSFTRPIDPAHVVVRHDTTQGMERDELRSRDGDSHLGHVFDDGPAPTHQRYCINSASLRFVALADLEAEGLGAYRERFDGGARALAFVAGPNSCTAPAPGKTAGCATTLETTYLAGGSLPCLQTLLGKTVGVIETERVRRATGDHAEAVRVVFDPKVVAYGDLLAAGFFRMHDPSAAGARSTIFVTSAEERRVAERALQDAAKSGAWPRPLATKIVDAGSFAAASPASPSSMSVVAEPGCQLAPAAGR